MRVPSRIAGILLSQAKWTARWRAGEVKTSNQADPQVGGGYWNITALMVFSDQRPPQSESHDRENCFSDFGAHSSSSSFIFSEDAVAH